MSTAPMPVVCIPIGPSRWVDAGCETPHLAITEEQLFARFRGETRPDGKLSPETLPRPDTISEPLYHATIRGKATFSVNPSVFTHPGNAEGKGFRWRTLSMVNRSIQLSNGHFSGLLHDNEANKHRAGAGFNPLTHRRYPTQNLYRDDAVGLNFEHIFNGTEADADICMFTPRRDACEVIEHSESSASIVHHAQDSEWNIESEMRYTFSSESCIDLQFTVIPRENRFPLGYVAFMWASYMNHTVDRRIYFWGREGQKERWVTFGESLETGFETGTIAYCDVSPLPYEQATKTLNIIEHPTEKFVYPFYYGLVHGSGGVDNPDDTMVYIMMFDQKAPIRFAMWNFIKDSAGKPDTHSPAWDWQYVIHQPQIDQEYGYRARVVYKPFKGRDDVMAEYENWQRVLMEENRQTPV
jgi:hypothetical protein